jgi:hypothetical protein
MFEYIENLELRQKATDEFNASIDSIKVDFSKQINIEVEKATSGIKANHDKLLDEKKKLQEKFKGITDPEEALKALSLINDNEEFRMIRDGKFEDVIQKRLSSVSTEYETKIAELNDKLSNHEMTATKYTSLFKDTVRDLRVKEAAIAAGVRPSAIDDILNKGRNVFTVADDEKSVEARDSKGHLRKTADDKILNVDLWIDSLRKTSPHYWPESKGGNLSSGGDQNDLQAMIDDAAKRGDSDLYRKLRAKQRAEKGKK